MSDTQKYLVKARCSFCRQPVYAEDGYHGASLDHYDCFTGGKPVIDPRAEMQAAMDAGNRAMASVFTELGVKPHKPRARAGEGALAQHVKKLVIEAIQEEFGCGVRSAHLWLQEGDYRGPKWDLDSWGVNAVLDDGHNRMIRCSSLATMGEYRRCKQVLLNKADRDGASTFDVLTPKESDDE